MTKNPPFAAPFALFLLALLPYLNTLGHGFTFDDDREILDNPLVRTFSWRGFLDAYNRPPGAKFPAGRPLPVLTYALNHAFGALRPFGYHLVNVLLNAVVAVLVWAATREVFPGRPSAAFLAAAFFAVHPIHTEVVASVIGRSELWASFFVLVALNLYLRSAPRPGAPFRPAAWLGPLLFLLGALSKGTALALIPLIAVCDLARFGRLRPAALLRHWLKHLLPYCAVLALFLVFFTRKNLPRGEEMLASSLIFLPAADRVREAIGILARYLVLLSWPARLSCDYGYAQLESVPAAVRSWWSAGGAAAIVGAALLAAASWKRRREHFFAVAVFAVSFAGVSNLVFPINTPMGERLLYLPSWGFSLFLAFLVESVFRRRPAAAYVIAAALAAAYGARTVARNRDWKDNFALFSAAYRVCPLSAKVNYNLGLECARRGMTAEALFHYRRAVEITPDNPTYHLNLGEALVQAGETERGTEEFREAIRLALPRVEEYAGLSGTLAGGHINLANVLWGQGKEEAAFAQLREAERIAPGDWRVSLNRGQIHLGRKRFREAEAELRRAAALNPAEGAVWNKIGVAVLERGEVDLAADCFRRAVSLQVDCKEAYNNLGACLLRKGERSAAEGAFRRALAIDPGYGAARENLARLGSSGI